MTSKSRQIEVALMGEPVVMRHRRTECLMSSLTPRQDVGEDLFTLVDTDHDSLVVLDFFAIVGDTGLEPVTSCVSSMRSSQLS